MIECYIFGEKVWKIQLKMHSTIVNNARQFVSKMQFTHKLKIFVLELEIQWKQSVTFGIVWAGFVCIVAESSSKWNVARFRLVAFEIQWAAKDHGHQWTKAANAWQNSRLVDCELFVGYTTLACVRGNHVFDWHILNEWKMRWRCQWFQLE